MYKVVVDGVTVECDDVDSILALVPKLVERTGNRGHKEDAQELVLRFAMALDRQGDSLVPLCDQNARQSGYWLKLVAEELRAMCGIDRPSGADEALTWKSWCLDLFEKFGIGEHRPEVFGEFDPDVARETLYTAIRDLKAADDAVHPAFTDEKE